MNSMQAIGLIGGLLASDHRNYGHGGYGRKIRRYARQKYENSSNKKRTGKQRAKNKAARKSRSRNRKP